MTILCLGYRIILFSKEGLMEVISFTCSDLKKLYKNYPYKKMNQIPITKQRIVSYCNNPRADADDVVLLIAKEKDKLLGYQGIVPDYIYNKKNATKIGWLSTWWQDPDNSKSGIGGLLLMKALKAYDSKVAVSASTKQAKEIYLLSGLFKKVKTFSGYKFRVQNTSNVPPRGIRKYKIEANNLLIEVQNSLQRHRYQNWLRINQKKLEKIDTEVVCVIDEETRKFLEKFGTQDLTQRRSAEFNWVRKYPWVLSTPLPDVISKKYYFSSVAQRFEIFFFKIYKQNDMVGFLVLTLRNSELSVQYAYYIDGCAEDICYFLLQFALAEQVHSIEILYNELSAVMKETGLSFINSREVQRSFLFAKPIIKFSAQPNQILHPGDGDNIFT